MPEEEEVNLDMDDPAVRSLIRDMLIDEINKIESEATSKIEAVVEKAESKLIDSALSLTNSINDQLTTATNANTSIATSKGTADQTSAQIQEIVSAAQTSLDTVNANRDIVKSLGDRSDEINYQLASLNAQVTHAEESVSDHQKEWNTSFGELFDRIEKLLPGAAGAGLASGFRSEKERYERKHYNSKFVFVGFLILIIGILYFRPIGNPVMDFWTHLLINLSLTLPAVWGAWWFNRQATTYDRLAEEYRHKESISTSVEGYTRQLEVIEGQEALKEYLKSAVQQICVPAGRVYDKKMLAASPFEEHAHKITDAIAARPQNDS